MMSLRKGFKDIVVSNYDNNLFWISADTNKDALE